MSDLNRIERLMVRSLSTPWPVVVVGIAVASLILVLISAWAMSLVS